MNRTRREGELRLRQRTFVHLKFWIGLLIIAAFGASSAMADVDTIMYTDAFSDTVSLVLTGTPDANGGLDVTSLTGTFNGSAVSGPLSNTLEFGPTSNEFYTNPSVLPPFTIDSGLVFQVPRATDDKKRSALSAVIDLYAYNYGGPGYATTLTYGGSYAGSGAVFIDSVSVVAAPEPSSVSWALVALGASVSLLALRKRRKSDLQQVP